MNNNIVLFKNNQNKLEKKKRTKSPLKKKISTLKP